VNSIPELSRAALEALHTSFVVLSSKRSPFLPRNSFGSKLDIPSSMSCSTFLLFILQTCLAVVYFLVPLSEIPFLSPIDETYRITDRGEIEDRKNRPRFEIRLNGLAAKAHRPRGIKNRVTIGSTGIVHQNKNQKNVLINHILNRRTLFMTRFCDRDARASSL